MSDDVKLSLSGDNKKLKRVLTDSERATARFEKKSLSNFGKFRNGLNNNSFANGLTSPFVGLLATGAVLAAGKQIVDFDSKLARLAIQGNITAEEQIKLREEIIKTANATGQGWNRMLGSSDAIVQRLGDMGLARDLMKDLGIAATATGAPMEDLGALAANLYQKIGISKDEMFSALNSLTAQGKMGAFTLEHMAAQGERLFAAASRFDIKGLDRFKKFGALVQISQMGTGSPEQATTAIEGMLSDIISKYKQIRKFTGVDIFTDSSRKNLKDMDLIIKGIITGAGGDKTIMQKIFGRESVRGISMLVDSYNKTGGFALFDDIASADAKQGAILMADFARYSKEAAPQLQRVANLGRKFADQALSPSIKRFADAFSNISDAKMERYTKSIDTMSMALGRLAEGALWALDGWVKLINLWDRMAKGSADFFYGTSDEEMHRGNIIDQFNALPDDVKKGVRERSMAGEKVNLEYEVKRYRTRMKKEIEEIILRNSGSAPNNGGAAPNNVDVDVNVFVDGEHVTANIKSEKATRTKIHLNRGDTFAGRNQLRRTE